MTYYINPTTAGTAHIKRQEKIQEGNTSEKKKKKKREREREKEMEVKKSESERDKDMKRRE